MSKKTLCKVLLLVVSALAGSLVGGVAARGRMPILTAKAAVGLTSGVIGDATHPIIGGPPGWQERARAHHAEDVRRSLLWRGHLITPANGADGDALALHEEISKAFYDNDLTPAPRTQRFKYMFNGWTQELPVPGLRGWNGQILSTEETPAGIAVHVRIAPNLSNPNGGGALIPADFWNETYLYHPATGRLTFLSADEDPDAIPGYARF